MSTALLAVGVTTINTVDTPLTGNQAQAHTIGINEQDIEKLKKYYTQEPRIFTDKELRFDKVRNGYYVGYSPTWGQM